MKTNIKVVFILFIAFQTHAQCWKNTASGSSHSLAIKTDGTLWTWGFNGTGQLGDGTTISKNTPTQIGSDTNWKVISAGVDFSVAIKTNGTLWTWGNNLNGQLGDNTFTAKNIPTQVGTETNWNSIDAGYYFCVALKGSFSKSLWSWGHNQFGQLGNGNLVDSATPSQIGTSLNWKSVSAGAYHVLALEFVTGGSRLLAWGYNGFGQLGDATFLDKSIPTQIGLDVTWQTLDSGHFHNLGKKTTATLWAWGWNLYRQLGDNTNANANVPIQITTDTDWQGVLAAGYNHSMVKKANGTLWSWGNSSNGQLGNGSTTTIAVPQQIGTATNWGNFTTAGDRFSTAMNQDGSLLTWGINANGEMGNGNNTGNGIPIVITCPTTLDIQKQIAENNTFIIYPNPATDILNIKTLLNKTVSNIKIIDLLGKNILETNIGTNAINIQKLSQGIYTVAITIDDINYQQKFIKN